MRLCKPLLAEAALPVVKMKENDAEQALREIEIKIASLPRGYLTVKKINGKSRHYIQWSEGGKKKKQIRQ